MLDLTSTHPQLTTSTRLRNITTITGIAMRTIRDRFLDYKGAAEIHGIYVHLWAQSLIEQSKLKPEEQAQQLLDEDNPLTP